jgi:hypothetical protein
MKPLVFILTFGFIGLQVSAQAAQQQLASNCEPVTESQQSFEGARITPGEYLITFVATKGNKSGSAVSGRMWLTPTSRRDKSPRTGESAPTNEDSARVPLYGAIDVDLSRVDAPMGDSDKISDPMSRDPIYPGVLAHVIDFYNAPKGQIALLIGTVSNQRTDNLYTDGAGIGLFVKKLDDDAFSGSWGPWGILNGWKRSFLCSPTKQVTRRSSFS